MAALEKDEDGFYTPGSIRMSFAGTVSLINNLAPAAAVPNASSSGESKSPEPSELITVYASCIYLPGDVFG